MTAIEKLQESQKVLANKIIKLTEACKNKLGKIDREHSEKYAKLETKLESSIYNIEHLKKEEVKLSNDVSNLKTEKSQVMKEID